MDELPWPTGHKNPSADPVGCPESAGVTDTHKLCGQDRRMTPRFCGLEAQVGSCWFLHSGSPGPSAGAGWPGSGEDLLPDAVDSSTTSLNCKGPLADFLNKISQ